MLQGGGSTQGEPDIKKSSMPGPSALPRQARYRRHEIQGLGILFAGLGFRVRLQVLEKNFKTGHQYRTRYDPRYSEFEKNHGLPCGVISGSDNPKLKGFCDSLNLSH